ncbi:hypothetical protein D8O27_07005 [Burkholderia mallei]|uniref:Uncharacterized protein n=1 Tax=Burkholderia pseudomallei TaxID=28450 RepID=A0AAX0U6P3_BURPE|nr:hypothetical protein BOC35_05990 [Burkholderia pseudomallei]EDO86644.1 hypothetical protein BURPS406E_P0456 [Burkholderia pseudomallei 406e]EDO95379.1 hypothetical protein BURPSPAST_X0021 [Burkholderia pseudomallei Pasteur 52237]EDU10579.1 hypothetical protein BURPS1655_C0706 [Burkholderia pseudomallei 1655]RKO00626.1 hypothetical protein D8O31_06965 [Burkholderia mallei]
MRISGIPGLACADDRNGAASRFARWLVAMPAAMPAKTPPREKGCGNRKDQRGKNNIRPQTCTGHPA